MSFMSIEPTDELGTLRVRGIIRTQHLPLEDCPRTSDPSAPCTCTEGEPLLAQVRKAARVGQTSIGRIGDFSA